jgi:hypothetical protein
VTNENIYNYIMNDFLNIRDELKDMDGMVNMNRTQLKRIAAKMETMKRIIAYYKDGRY